MPSLRSVKDASGRATMRRQIKKVDMPEVPDVPGMKEELNRRRSRHFSTGNGIAATEPFINSDIEMQKIGQTEYCARPGSSSRASSSCADQYDLYNLPNQYSTSSFTSIPMSNNGRQSFMSPCISTFQQPSLVLLNNTASLLQQNHRNSTGSSSSQASSGFESSKNLNNFTGSNSNSSGSFASTLFTTDSSPPPSIGASGTDTLRKSINSHSNRHSSAGSEASSSRSRSQCSHSVPNPQINIAEMISRGIPDSEILGEWLEKMGMQRYLSLFITQGFDIPSIGRLTSEDLLALGISDPNDRRRLHSNIQEWNVNDNWPTNMERTDSAALWLVTIGLQQYVRLFENEGYIQMKDLENLSFEELEDMGIKKLGHIKRICLALRKLKQHRRQSTSASSSSNLVSNQSSHQQFHSPDSGFTETSSLFSNSQRLGLSIRQDTPILDDLLDKPASKLQIYSTRQIFAENNEPYYGGIPPLQFKRRHSPPPPAPNSSLLHIRQQPASARPFFEHSTANYMPDWIQRPNLFRSQPQTPIRQQHNIGETSFIMSGIGSELNAINMAK